MSSLGPVGQREHADVLAGPVLAVVEVPQLRPLVARVPLAELVAEAEHALLGARLLLVPARAAEHGVEPALPGSPAAASSSATCSGWRVAGVRDDAAGVDVVLHAGDHQPQAHVGDDPVAELEHLVEVVPGVHVQHRKRQWCRPERACRDVQHHHRVLAAGEQQHRPLERRRDLTEDVYGLGLERTQVGQLVRRRHRKKVEHVLVTGQALVETGTMPPQGGSAWTW